MYKFFNFLLFLLFLVVISLGLIGLRTVLVESNIESNLLKLCPNQAEIAEKRVVSCIAPVRLDVVNGKVTKIYWEAK